MSDDGASGGDAPAPGAPEANLTAARFRPGQSGNPGGRPPDLPRFRKACRKRSWKWLASLDRLMASKRTPADEKLAIWKAVSDRGGYLTFDRQAAIDTGNARLLVLAAALKDLSRKQREALLAAIGGWDNPGKPSP